MRKQKPKPKVLKIADGVKTRTTYLFDVSFEMRDGRTQIVKMYSPCANEVMGHATRMYAGKGSFVRPLSFTKA